jgi:hypothetical protein
MIRHPNPNSSLWHSFLTITVIITLHAWAQTNYFMALIIIYELTLWTTLLRGGYPQLRIESKNSINYAKIYRSDLLKAKREWPSITMIIISQSSSKSENSSSCPQKIWISSIENWALTRLAHSAYLNGSETKHTDLHYLINMLDSILFSLFNYSRLTTIIRMILN